MSPTRAQARPHTSAATKAIARERLTNRTLPICKKLPSSFTNYKFADFASKIPESKDKEKEHPLPSEEIWSHPNCKLPRIGEWNPFEGIPEAQTIRRRSSREWLEKITVESHQQICSHPTAFDENSAKEIQMSNGNLKEGKSHCSGLKHGTEKALQRRRECAWHVINEIVDTEECFVRKLALLQMFIVEVRNAKILNAQQYQGLNHLFANILSLHQFHSEQLLPELMHRRNEWRKREKISRVLFKLTSLSNIYSEYVLNYKLAIKILEKCMRKNSQFRAIVKRFEYLPECGHQPLASFLIWPIQRLTRYHLLLRQYQKYLTPNCPDFHDTEMALVFALRAASDVNEMMRMSQNEQSNGQQYKNLSPKRKTNWMNGIKRNIFRKVKMLAIVASAIGIKATDETLKHR